MNKKKQTVCRCLTAVAIIGCGFLTVTSIPHGDWLKIGRQTAFFSVGLRQPEESAQLLEQLIVQEPLGTGSMLPTLPTTIPPLSAAQSRPLPSLTTTGSVTIPSGGGRVLTQTLSSGSSFIQNVAFNNKSGKSVDMTAVLKRKLSLTIDKSSDKPQVLITHTHTTECYLSRDDGVYAPDDATRTHDAAKNMVAVGEAVAARLRQAGIGVIHDTVIHDEPYNGAYTHSKAEVQRLLKQYPSIQVVLDLHRDAIYPSDTTRVKPVAVINEKKAAQVMIVVGMKNTTAVPNSYTDENLSFGARLQQYLHTNYAGLVRPMLLADARYNQHLAGGSLLLEMGADANTVEEALYSAELVGEGLSQILHQLSK